MTGVTALGDQPHGRALIRTYVRRRMTTYTLKMTPPDAPATIRRGLTREQTLWALAELMYGFERPEADEERREERLRAAA